MKKNPANNINALLDELQGELLDTAHEAKDTAKACNNLVRCIDDDAFEPFIPLMQECSQIIKENYGLKIRYIG